MPKSFNKILPITSEIEVESAIYHHSSTHINTITERLNNHILSFVWLLFFIWPNNQILLILIPVAYVLLFSYRKRIHIEPTVYLTLLSMLLIISCLLNVDEAYFSMKAVSRASVFILMFLTFGKLRGSHILAPYIYFTVAFLVLSQFSALLNFTLINTFIDSFYNDANTAQELTSFTSLDISQYKDLRLGGIYFNPNNYASYLELILAVILCEIKQFSRASLITLLCVITISLIVTGSRTSLLVLAATVIYYLFLSDTLSFKKAMLICSTLAITMMVIFFACDQISSLRVIKISEGLDNSFLVKVGLLKDYIATVPPIAKILIGNFSEESLRQYLAINLSSMDFDFGNIVLCYGILFFFSLLFFYIKIFKLCLPKYKILFIMLLWMFSNSILMSYRMSALWIMILGLYYYRSTLEKTTNVTRKL